MLSNSSQGPNNNANPSGLSEKNVYCVESLQFFFKVEISLYSKNHCCAILIRFGDGQFVDTFCGVELGPET